MKAKLDDPNKFTRMLLENPEPYAELDENARIALSVLRDGGWKTQRIGLQLGVDITVSTTPIERPGIDAELADCELRYTALRSEVMALHQRNVDLEALRVATRAEIVSIRRRHWLAAAAGFFVCAVLAWLQYPLVMAPLGYACTLAWHFLGYRRAKGAK